MGRVGPSQGFEKDSLLGKEDSDKGREPAGASRGGRGPVALEGDNVTSLSESGGGRAAQQTLRNHLDRNLLVKGPRNLCVQKLSQVRLIIRKVRDTQV